MAKALFITATWSPDVQEMFSYFSTTIQRFGERAADPRVQEFIADVQSLDGAGLVDRVEGEEKDFEIVLIPGDELLRIIAKMRAIERAVFGAQKEPNPLPPGGYQRPAPPPAPPDA